MSPKKTNPPPADQVVEDKKLINGSLPKIPEEFSDLHMLNACHPNLFKDQATLLRARYDAFVSAGFSESDAMKLLLRWGLKENLTDT